MLDCTCNTDTGWHLCTSQPLVTMHFQQSKTKCTLNSNSWLDQQATIPQIVHQCHRQFYHRKKRVEMLHRICKSRTQNLQCFGAEFWRHYKWTSVIAVCFTLVCWPVVVSCVTAQRIVRLSMCVLQCSERKVTESFYANWLWSQIWTCTVVEDWSNA